jgi:sec-independent protein translocase protein TatA
MLIPISPVAALTLAFIGNPTQMIIILVIILLLFGSRLPSLMRSLGSSVSEFKKGIKQAGDDENGPSEKT